MSERKENTTETQKTLKDKIRNEYYADTEDPPRVISFGHESGIESAIMDFDNVVEVAYKKINKGRRENQSQENYDARLKNMEILGLACWHLRNLYLDYTTIMELLEKIDWDQPDFSAIKALVKETMEYDANARKKIKKD